VPDESENTASVPGAGEPGGEGGVARGAERSGAAGDPPVTTEAGGAPGDPGPAAAAMRRLGGAAWLAVAWAVLPALGGFILLAQVEPASAWLRGLGGGALLVYVAVFTVSAGLGVLPTYAQAFFGGWAFGSVPGTLAALAGFVGASAIGRVIARTVARGKVLEEIDRHEKARAVRDALVGQGPLRTLGIVTLVRVPPNSPFALTNGVLSTTGVPLWIYLVGTAVGMLPRTAVVVWLGAEFAQQFDDSLSGAALKEARPGWYLPVAIVVSIAVVFALVQIGQRAINTITGPTDSAAGAE